MILQMRHTVTEHSRCAVRTIDNKVEMLSSTDAMLFDDASRFRSDASVSLLLLSERQLDANKETLFGDSIWLPTNAPMNIKQIMHNKWHKPTQPHFGARLWAWYIKIKPLIIIIFTCAFSKKACSTPSSFGTEETSGHACFNFGNRASHACLCGTIFISITYFIECADCAIILSLTSWRNPSMCKFRNGSYVPHRCNIRPQ